MKRSQLIALIDTDIIVHKACFYHQYRLDEDDPELERVCTDTALDMCFEWATLSGASFVVPVYSMPGEKNFRHYIYPEYKAHRKDKPKPKYKQECFDYIAAELGAVTQPGVEADDMLGILHTDEGYDTVLVTTDKDMQQIPGMQFNPDKDWSPKQLSVEHCLRFLAIQTLMGDSTDNIPGIKNVGIKKASTLVDTWLDLGVDYTNLQDEVLTFYLSQGYSYENYQTTYDLVRIYTQEDEWTLAPQLKQSTDALISDQKATRLNLGQTQ